jgi:4-hydroxyphenylpyruvate dioxygenase
MVDRKGYKGTFLPGFKPHYNQNDNILKLLPKINLNFIDHVVGNQPDLEMEGVAEW